MDAATLLEPTLVATLGGVLVALGVVGLLRARDERLAARLAALLAMLAAFYAAFDGAERATRTEPADLRIVTTGPADAAWVPASGNEGVDRGEVTVFAAGERHVAEAGLAAALAASAPQEVVLVWDGPVAEDAAWPEGAWSGAFATARPGPFEAGDVVVRVSGEARDGRPLLVEFDLAREARDGLPDGALLTYRMRRRVDDAEGPSGRIDASPLREGAAGFTWPIASAGAWEIGFELVSDGHRLAATGDIEVGPPARPVVVLGAGAAAYATALAAQAVPCVVHERLPDEVADVVVLTGPVSAEEATRLLDLVDRGAGLVVIGGPSGGALPLAEDLLAAIVPLHREPLPEDGVGGAAEPSSEAGPGEASPAEPGATPPAESKPAPDRPAAEPPPDAPTGGVEAAGGPVQKAEVERRQVALVLVIDRSSSMGAAVSGLATRMDFAKRAAFETALRLEPGDELGVIAFGVRAYEVLELGPVPSERVLESKLEGLRAIDSQTVLGGAVGRAFAWLRDSEAAVRHAVILTDGDRLDAGDLTLAQSAARRMGEAGISVSVIQIADTAVGLVRDLNAIAQQGKGVFLRETDGSAIPRLVFAEVRRMLGAAGRVADGPAGAGAGGAGAEGAPVAEPQPTTEPERPTEEPADPPPDEPEPVGPEPAEPAPAPVEPLPVVVLDEGPVVGPVPDGGLPDLYGISPVVATERARVLLATIDGTPLLASAHAGLGRVVAWAADVAGPWTEAWRGDPLFPARLAGFVEAVRPAVPSADALPVPLDTQACEPVTPRRAIWGRLRAAAGGVEPSDPGALAFGPDRRIPFLERRGLDLALGAAVGILALALIERFRRGVSA